MPRLVCLSFALCLAIAVLSGSPASADWLVLRDGGALQTDGTWRVSGKLLVFKKADGTLASIRSAEVDLEASRRLTEAKGMPSAEAPPEAEPSASPQRSALVLTDADVAHVVTQTTGTSPSDPAAETDDVEADAEAEDTPPVPRDGQAVTAGAVEVTEWREVVDFEYTGSKIGGRIRNASDRVAVNIVLHLRLTNVDGMEIARQRASTVRTGLEPGAETSFMAEFSGVYSWAGIDFEIESFDALRRGANP